MSGIWDILGKIGSFALNFLGGAGGAAAMNAGLGVVSSKQQYKYARKLAAQSYDYNRRLQTHSKDLSKSLQAYQNAYTTKMASTAHQIEVGDLRKAGLNPILSATGGNGASFSTGGATVGGASVGTGSVGAPDYGDAVAAYQSYLDTKRVKKDIELAEKQKNNLDADSYLKGNQAQVESEKFATQTNLTRQIDQDIKNSIAITAAQVDNLRKQGDSALINAIANRESSSASAWYNRHRALGYSESKSSGKSGGINGSIMNKASGGVNYGQNDSYSRTW